MKPKYVVLISNLMMPDFPDSTKIRLAPFKNVRSQDRKKPGPVLNEL